MRDMIMYVIGIQNTHIPMSRVLVSCIVMLSIAGSQKLRMCRICLAQNTRMYVLVNKNLRDLYEKLTDIPFVTEDKRPILACFLCRSELKQCFRLRKKCLEAEEQFAQMTNEPNPLTNPDRLVSCSGFIKTPIEKISIVDKCQMGSIAIKEPLPAVCEGLVDVIEPKEENLSDDLEPDVDNSYLDEDMLPDHSEPDSKPTSEGDVTFIEIKIEMEEAIEVSEKKQTAAVTNSAHVTRKTKLDETITVELKKNEPSNLKVFQPTRNRTPKPGTSFEESDECDQRSLYEVKKLKQHTQTRINKKHECDVCQRSFSQINNLTRHIRTHTGVKPYMCHVCQRSFSDKGHLTRHIRIHTGEKPFKCDKCLRSFTQKYHLAAHIRTHTGVKHYKCDVCHRRFSEKRNLTDHIRIHTGEKPHKCDVCQRSFSRLDSLTRHNRIHTGVKHYKCDVCQCSFSEKINLSTHIRIHTGEKPFKCDVCQRSFTQKITLTKHIRTHAGLKRLKPSCFTNK